jgi:hypothetical protein
MTKYREVYNDMLENHKELFDTFKKTHDDFAEDPDTNRKNFNETGQDVLRIIQRYENILCGRSEGGRYGKFSSNLSDKFRGYIRQHFPKIDQIGMQ